LLRCAIVTRSLGYELHELIARLDRAADRILREQEGISYSRFLALFAVSEGAGNQRALASWLAQSEPSTSRMVGVLTREGLLEASKVAGAGNRRHLRLTGPGAEVVNRCGRLLQGRFEDLVEQSGVPYRAYQNHTRRLLSQLEAHPWTATDLTSAA
jgi:DNA-binding MarR family transcriptional regulator